MTRRAALGSIPRAQSTYFYATTSDSPTLLRQMVRAYSIRTQVFRQLNVFDVASLIDAARLKPSFGPVERSKFLHPLRAIFTDMEFSLSRGTTCP